MDKLEFGLGAIGIVAAIEGIAIYTGRDGALLAALTGIIGAVAGSALGFSLGTKTVEQLQPVIDKIKEGP